MALRHARELKLANESREKCASFLNRVEEVLSVIVNAESTKKVIDTLKKNLCFTSAASLNCADGVNRT